MARADEALKSPSHGENTSSILVMVTSDFNGLAKKDAEWWDVRVILPVDVRGTCCGEACYTRA